MKSGLIGCEGAFRWLAVDHGFRRQQATRGAYLRGRQPSASCEMVGLIETKLVRGLSDHAWAIGGITGADASERALRISRRPIGADSAVDHRVCRRCM